MPSGPLGCTWSPFLGVEAEAVFCGCCPHVSRGFSSFQFLGGLKQKGVFAKYPFSITPLSKIHSQGVLPLLSDSPTSRTHMRACFLLIRLIVRSLLSWAWSSYDSHHPKMEHACHFLPTEVDTYMVPPKYSVPVLPGFSPNTEPKFT